jgi:hypothetical protein
MYKCRNGEGQKYNDAKLYKYYFGVLVILLLLNGVSQIVRAYLLNETCVLGLTEKLQAGINFSTIVSFVQIFLTFIVMTAAGFVVYGIPDKFNIGLEIRIASISFVIIVIASVILIIKIGQPEIATIPLIIYFPVCFLMNGISPYLLYRKKNNYKPITVQIDYFLERLRNENFYERFRAFAADEFSCENVLAWKQIQEFNRLQLLNDPTAADLARTICDDYIRETGQDVVNIDDSIAKTVIEDIDSNKININTFDMVEKALIQLMYSDTYRRFIQDARQSTTLTTVSDLDLEAQDTF